MEHNELKPCPFCGCTEINIYSYDPYDGYQGNLSTWKIQCLRCSANMERSKKNDVIEAWNRRVNNGT